jgi:hypothetical protein
LSKLGGPDPSEPHEQKTRRNALVIAVFVVAFIAAFAKLEQLPIVLLGS